MEVNKRDNEGGGEAQTQDPTPNPNPNPNPSHPQTRVSKGKSCKGCLYYSSDLQSKSKNPRCVGFSESLPQVSSSIVGKTELEASKKGLSLTGFKYACAGYSVYIDNKDSAADQQDKIAKLPVCIGLEMVLAMEPKTAAGQSPAPAQRNEENKIRAPSSTTDGYFKRQAYIFSIG
ncbi:uncharacterized protein G2W53_003343 [Senna tora]|uniref:DUF8204 domain-containing protein n=1 Tax=Senna tora TaxID=362788 RepID=A0A834XA16_9FABA|nr:uncharacterized protein G2W53_003343 [Senna tora]